MSNISDTVWSMQPNVKLAIQLAKRDLSELVYDAVNLEGVAMTLPEIQTILDGITVGGHKISDQNMALNQAKAWEYIFELVNKNIFTLEKKTALDIHAIAGENEALEWGKFRNGNVTISGSNFEPPEPDELDSCWAKTLELVNCQNDIYDKSILLFLQMARNQFFWDVNKRTGRFMMNGLLLSYGYPIINVPYKRKQEFNTLMLEFYSTNIMKPMNDFLRSCIHVKIIDNFKMKR